MLLKINNHPKVCYLILLLLSLVLYSDQNPSEPFQANPCKACDFFVWNFFSAGIYSLRKHLLKECSYIGRGGRQFVIISPGSLLQVLYPMKNFSPDECVWCGGKYEDHIKLAWAKKKHLYSPFDLSLDEVTKRARRSKIEQVWKTIPPEIRTIYKFHERYVVDVDSLVTTSKRKSEKRRLSKEKIKQQYGSDKTVKTYIAFGIKYVLPSFPEPGLSKFIVLNQLNRLIQIQEYENEAIDLQQRGQFTRGRARRLKAKFGQI